MLGSSVLAPALMLELVPWLRDPVGGMMGMDLLRPVSCLVVNMRPDMNASYSAQSRRGADRLVLPETHNNRGDASNSGSLLLVLGIATISKGAQRTVPQCKRQAPAMMIRKG